MSTLWYCSGEFMAHLPDHGTQISVFHVVFINLLPLEIAMLSLLCRHSARSDINLYNYTTWDYMYLVSPDLMILIISLFRIIQFKDNLAQLQHNMAHWQIWANEGRGKISWKSYLQKLQIYIPFSTNLTYLGRKSNIPDAMLQTYSRYLTQRNWGEFGVSLLLRK